MYNSTIRGRNRGSPGSIPARTVWKPQLRLRHLWTGVREAGDAPPVGRKNVQQVHQLLYDLGDVS